MKRGFLAFIITVMAFSSVFISCKNDVSKNNGKAPKVEIVADPTAKK